MFIEKEEVKMSMKKIALAFIAAAIIIPLALTAAACDGDEEGTSARSPEAEAAEGTVEPGETLAADVAAAEDTAAVEVAVDDVFLVIQQRDQDRLRDFTGDKLQDRIQDQDLQQVATCIPDGTTVDLVSREVVVSGDTATATATFKITQDGETTDVQKVWEFQRQDDGTWALSALPECPFQ